MTAASRRVGQFWRHASARVAPEESRMAAQVLGPTLAPLFIELPVNDQRHGLDVLTTVFELERQPSQLLQQAALIHDIGKREARFSVLDRSLTVSLKALSPRVLAAWLRLRPNFARRFQIYDEHARIGAERVKRSGANELAAVLAEHHSPQPKLEVTRQLQRADQRN